mmetsp:Transcript_82891/g.138356  ORF Transcript_82891/g.138356 Transcript_82891/m.138356 type:complete len:89 (-) Transcript_82891:653-919(-)
MEARIHYISCTTLACDVEHFATTPTPIRNVKRTHHCGDNRVKTGAAGFFNTYIPHLQQIGFRNQQLSVSQWLHTSSCALDALTYDSSQ